MTMPRVFDQTVLYRVRTMVRSLAKSHYICEKMGKGHGKSTKPNDEKTMMIIPTKAFKYLIAYTPQSDDWAPGQMREGLVHNYVNADEYTKNLQECALLFSLWNGAWMGLGWVLDGEKDNNNEYQNS